jgi:lysine biosynthesis protein LysW
MIITVCPDCSNELSVSENPRIGGSVACDSCGQKLEIVWLYPLEVDYQEEKTSCEINNQE